MVEGLNIAIVGATGMVGSAALSILEERQFPIKNIYLLASKHSAGDTREFAGKPYWVEDVAQFDFSQTQLCFFCISNELAAHYAPIAAGQGNIVIDKSAYYRYDADVPLVVPEVNPEDLSDFRKRNIIASPNCSTIPIVMAIKPIYDAVGITRMNIATYQSVSGSGKEAVSELAHQSAELLNGRPIKSQVYPQQIAFNVLPHIDDFQDNGYTKEEMKMIWEIQKIFQDPSIGVNPTAVRVPVFYGHSAAVHLETEKKISKNEAIKLMKKMTGLVISQGKFPYSTPVQDAAGHDEVYVGRVREDISCENGLNFWVVSDNIRKGAALNAVQIAEQLMKMEVF